MLFKGHLSVIVMITILSLVIVSHVQSRFLRNRVKRSEGLNTCDVIKIYTGRECPEHECASGKNENDSKAAASGILTCCKLLQRCYTGVPCAGVNTTLLQYSMTCSDQRVCQCMDSPDDSPCLYNMCLCDIGIAQCLKAYDDETANKQ